jgi:hypothetical protein
MRWRRTSFQGELEPRLSIDHQMGRFWVGRNSLEHFMETPSLISSCRKSGLRVSCQRQQVLLAQIVF